MAYAQSFPTVIRPARYDDIPWTSILVDEAALPTGPFTQVADVPITADPTPSSPDLLSFTIATATLEVGYYRFRFRDDAGITSSYTAPLRAPSFIQDDAAYLPAVDDVAALERARTKDNNGNELGAFTADTRPTEAQVVRLITLAASQVAARVINPIVAPYLGAGRNAIALRTAMLIEVSYFPEETETRDSAYGRFASQYNDAVAELQLACREYGMRLS